MLVASPAYVPQPRDYGEAGPPTSSYGGAGIAIDRFDGTIVGQQLEEGIE